ncbi:MAG: DUF2470 domain-containing protein [Rhodospirillaceae bacterium]|nr:DUF2470 domain-containing protein [Rhodospirillaceae bacterium]
MSEIRDTPGAQARQLLRAADRAALGTLLRAEAGGHGNWPYASLVLTAVDHDACPILLISTLADHTRNIAVDPHVSLLFDGTAGFAEPLTGPRVSVQGRATRTDDAHLRTRFIARHPSASFYAGFKDFSVYRVTVERAHLVAGFGRIHWIEGKDVAFDTGATRALAEAEPDILAHMNSDHAEAIDLYASRILGKSGGGWKMTGIDPEGIDLRQAGETARLNFETTIGDPGAARAALVQLASVARAAAKTA